MSTTHSAPMSTATAAPSSPPTRRECAITLSIYGGLAVVFGLWVRRKEN
ncbi:MAG: hypothetical protein JOZ49_24895 [Mycolicibacterium sp.]|nr:hypothetical protein [Mycolicibacterium sp.]